MKTVEIKDFYQRILAFEVYYDNGDVELLGGPFSKQCRLPYSKILQKYGPNHHDSK